MRAPAYTRLKDDLVVARAVIARAGRLLLVRRAAWDTMPGVWELPGGKVDAGETVVSAVIREVGEETGLAAAGVPSLWFEQPLVGRSGRRILEQVYRLETAGAPTLSHEHDDWIWHAPGELLPAPLSESATTALTLAPVA
jgi:8-oxo-dGTP pyrophosphatase MutT (NUDIX family)